MIDIFDDIVAVGFDLDGTLYKLTKEINDRIRNKIAERILERKPDLENILNARTFFESEYKRLHSGIRVMEEIGYKNAGFVMDGCLAEADIIDLLNEDNELRKVLDEIKENYITYLLTSNPELLSLDKLSALGIDENVFHLMTFSDTPRVGRKYDGTAFNYIVKETLVPPENHVYIGDRLNSDILPAKKIGMKTIAVGSEIPEADYSIKDIKEIRNLLF